MKATLNDRFRLRCPTSSPWKALAWFELKSSGLRVLAIGFAIAILIYSLFAIGIPFIFPRVFAVIAAFGAVPAMLILGRNAFGIRRKHGRSSVSSFEAMQPCGTAQMAGVKLLVRIACIFAAMIAIGLSILKSSELINEWGPWVESGTPEDVARSTRTNDRLLLIRNQLTKELLGGEHGFGVEEALGFPIILSLVTVVMASFSAFRARYPRGTLVVCALVLLFFISLANLNDSLSPAMNKAIDWIICTALALTSLHFLRSGFADRALTISYVSFAFAVGATLVAISFPSPPDAIAAQILIPLTVCLSAPWALNRARHM